MSSDDVNRPEAVPPISDCWFLTGPTASGKTKIGLELAERLKAEIISLDSMAVYRGMDIGTAKPSAAERQRISHHLLDVVDPNVEYSISEYVDAAHEVAEQIRGRGKQVLFVGGTPLYLKALLRGVYQGPPADWEFRQEIEKELQEVGLEALHQRLALVDPLSAAKLHPNDKRRIIRALEVHRVTGEPLSHRQLQFDEVSRGKNVKVFSLFWPREILHQRIENRVDAMFEAGLVAEVQSVLEKYGSLSRTAAQAVGYQEVAEMLQQQAAGIAVNEESVRDRVKARTRQFARRQETWFRSLSECVFVPQTAESTPSLEAERILTLAQA